MLFYELLEDPWPGTERFRVSKFWYVRKNLHNSLEDIMCVKDICDSI